MKLNVVFFHPAIIENVGNIARTCLAFNASLHLIRPYGFIFNKSRLNRSSTNHFDQIDFFEYDNWDEFEQKNNGEFFLFTKIGTHSPDEINYLNYDDKNIYLVFGNEHYGIDSEIMKKYQNNLIRIPINENLICINVSNSVAIGCYEVSKQFKYQLLKK